MLPAQAGASLPPSPPATSPLPPCLLLDLGPACNAVSHHWEGLLGVAVSPSWSLSITVGPAQVPSCIQHCSLRLALARPQDRRQGRRARKPKLALGLLAGCLSHRRGNQESVQTHFQEALRSPSQIPGSPTLQATVPTSCLTPRQMAQWLRAQALVSSAAYLLCDLGQVT